MIDPALTVRDVAEILHVHVNTVKRLPPEVLPYVRIVSRGDRRYDPRDVARYLEDRRA